MHLYYKSNEHDLYQSHSEYTADEPHKYSNKLRMYVNIEEMNEDPIMLTNINILYNELIVKTNERFFKQLRNLKMRKSLVRKYQCNCFLMALIGLGHITKTHENTSCT